MSCGFGPPGLFSCQEATLVEGHRILQPVVERVRDQGMPDGDLLQAGDLLGEGEAPKGLTIKVHKASAGAVKKIEAAGGKVEVIA